MNYRYKYNPTRSPRLHKTLIKSYIRFPSFSWILELNSVRQLCRFYFSCLFRLFRYISFEGTREYAAGPYDCVSVSLQAPSARLSDCRLPTTACTVSGGHSHLAPSWPTEEAVSADFITPDTAAGL